jgi:hypothetical protein
VDVAFPEPTDLRDSRTAVFLGYLDHFRDQLRRQGRRTRDIVEAHHLDDVGQPGPRWRGAQPATLERVLFHLVQEYARHLGQLDVVVELATGATGESRGCGCSSFTCRRVANIAAVTAGDVAGDRRVILRRRIRLLVAATITYNVVEAIVALAAGTIAGSVALVGFGLDSVIEVTSAAAVAWQFTAADPERRERTALRIVAFSFFALAAFVTVEAVRTLVTGAEPERSTVGIVLVAVSVAVMPFLSWAQRSAGRELGSASAVADSHQTLLCTYLSAGVLAGLLLNAWAGWWWADPVVALGLAVVAVREGREALRGRTCCAPIRLDDDRDDACGCAPGCTAPCCAGASR